MLLHSQTDGKCWVGGPTGSRGKAQPIQTAWPRIWEMVNDFAELCHGMVKTPDTTLRGAPLGQKLFFSLRITLPPFHIINQSPWQSAEGRQRARQQHLRQRALNSFYFADRHIISTRHRLWQVHSPASTRWLACAVQGQRKLSHEDCKRGRPSLVANRPL